MSRINTNVSSLIAQKTLSRSNADLQTSLNRLSTGLRINSGKDDPAGLIASENLRRDITASEKAITNSQRANQLISTADSALGQISGLLNDIRGLVTEAANTGVLSDEQIAANQLQVDSSLEAIDRIAQVTTFQGRKLIDGSLAFISSYTSGGSTVSDLQINKATIGSSGTLPVSVSISTAATQALLSYTASGFGAGTAAAGSLTFTDTAASQATNTNIALTNSTGGLSVSATAGGAADGVAGNSVDLTLQRATDAATASATLSLSGSGGSFDIDAAQDTAVDGAAGNSVSIVTQRAADAVLATGTFSLSNTSGSFDVTAAAGTTVDGAAGNATVIAIGRDSGASVSTGTISLSNSSGSFDISAVANTASDGVKSDSLSIIIGSSGAATGAVYDSNLNTLTVNVNNGGSATITDIANAIGGLAEFTTSNITGTTYNALDDNTYGGLTGGADGTTTASYSGGTLTVNVGVGATVADIATAVDGTAEFSTSNVTSGSTVYDFTDDNSYNSVLSTGADGTTGAVYASGTLTISAAVGATITDLAGAVDTLAQFSTSNVTSGSSAYDFADDNTYSSQFTGGDDGTTTAAYASGVITAGVAVGGTISDVATAIDGLADFSASAASGGSNAVDSADFQTFTDTLSNGADALADVLTITSDETGTAYNGTLTFSLSGSVAANGVSVTQTGSNIAIALNSTSTYTLSDLATAIGDQLTGYTVAVGTGTGDGSFVAGTDTNPTAADLTGGVDDTDTGLAADLVFQLSGDEGSEVFSFNAGATVSQIVTSVNLLTDSTGVQATNNAGTLELRSSGYGTSATIDADVVSEGTGGDFSTGLSGTHANGTDIVGTINGYQANGSANTLSINTSVLGLSLTVADGSSTAVDFSIDGGGAVFQLGPDVVSSQQARIGIESVNTASLGGVNGRLYELKSGNAHDLATDPNTAAKIVDEAINKVTSLRGRLGAFQRTTLETNIASLTDTISNLTEAESSIRDADFASETAKLTRAQILVQSGTQILQIANSNPQNVLSLLRG